MSWWTEQDPKLQLLIDRETQYACAIPKIGAATVDVQDAL